MARWAFFGPAAALLASAASGLQVGAPVRSPALPSASSSLGKARLTFLEHNSWLWQVNGNTVLVDPLLEDDLVFLSTPALYRASKRVVDGPSVLRAVAPSVSTVLITQSLDDHAHIPTLDALASLLPESARFVVAPNAEGVVRAHSRPGAALTVLQPGDATVLGTGRDAVEVLATTGAKVGPPWQRNENGYILRPTRTSRKFPSLYLEPHAMFDEDELSRYSVDAVITPVVTQELLGFKLVDGMDKALRLARTLGAKTVVPMLNGDIDGRGPLNDLIEARGSLEEFRALCRRRAPELNVQDVQPGAAFELRA